MTAHKPLRQRIARTALVVMVVVAATPFLWMTVLTGRVEDRC